MGVQLNPYLNFPGTSRAAMQTYQAAFGGSLELSTFGESGMAGEGVDPDSIMHAMLSTDDGFVLMASDVPPGPDHRLGAGSPISLSGDDEPRLRGWWDALSAGGTVTMDLMRAPWGATCGAFTDRFGTEWLVNIAGGPAQ